MLFRSRHIPPDLACGVPHHDRSSPRNAVRACGARTWSPGPKRGGRGLSLVQTFTTATVETQTTKHAAARVTLPAGDKAPAVIPPLPRRLPLVHRTTSSHAQAASFPGGLHAQGSHTERARRPSARERTSTHSCSLAATRTGATAHHGSRRDATSPLRHGRLRCGAINSARRGRALIAGAFIPRPPQTRLRRAPGRYPPSPRSAPACSLPSPFPAAASCAPRVSTPLLPRARCVQLALPPDDRPRAQQRRGEIEARPRLIFAGGRAPAAVRPPRQAEIRIARTGAPLRSSS